MRTNKPTRALVLAAACILSAASSATTLNHWGSGTVISVRDCSGSASNVGCGTDVPAPHVVPLLGVGGLFVAVDEANSSGPSSGASRVTFSGNMFEAPTIQASAFSSPVDMDNTRVVATTGAYQGYTYKGATDAIVTFTASLDFQAMSDSEWPGPGGAFVSAAIGLFDTDLILDDGLASGPSLGLVTGTLLDFDQVRFDGPFDGSTLQASLQFDVLLSPGTSFFVGASLAVGAERGAFVDAFSTFSTTFTGDPDVLVNLFPATSVPLPAAVWLFGGALAGLLTLGRRRPRDA